MSVRRVTPSERVVGDPTPGMTREAAFEIEGMWSGFVRTDAGMTSGWHHHGDHDTAIYVLRGALRLESGPGGREVVEAVSGDFVLVPRGTVHRESNPADEASHLIVTRSGSGPPTINVEGPEPGHG